MQHTQHVLQIEALVWKVEITAFDRWLTMDLYVRYREKATKPFVSDFYCSIDHK